MTSSISALRPIKIGVNQPLRKTADLSGGGVQGGETSSDGKSFVALGNLLLRLAIQCSVLVPKFTSEFVCFSFPECCYTFLREREGGKDQHI